MSFSEEQDKKPWWKTVAAVGVGVLACVIAKVVVSGGLYAFSHSETRIGWQFEEEISKPPMVAIFQAMREEFPDEFEKFKKSIVDKAAHGASSDDLRLISFNEMRNFSTRHAPDLGQASHQLLSEFRQKQIAILDLLSDEDVTLCAHFANKGFEPFDRPSKKAMTMVGEAVALRVRAMADGARHPTGRDIEKLSDSDAVAFVQSLKRQGLSESEIETLSGSSGFDQAASDMQCKIGAAILRAAGTLPSAQADRVTAIILSAT